MLRFSLSETNNNGVAGEGAGEPPGGGRRERTGGGLGAEMAEATPENPSRHVRLLTPPRFGNARQLKPPSLQSNPF